MTDNFALQSWIPYKLAVNDNQAEVHWLDTMNIHYNEPFFDETISKIKSIGRTYKSFRSVSDLALMEEWSDSTDYIKPTAFIFHVSRCGSTLVSQLLSGDEKNIVLPEVPFFDDLLRLPYKLSDIKQEQANKLLTAAIRFYGQKRTGNERHLFIKTDSWHIHFYKQLRQLYPGTPFILLYRTPVEVFDSHTKQPGIHAVPGLLESQIFGMDAEQANTFDLNNYLAAVLESYYTAYLNISTQDKLTLLVNYNEGIMTIMDKIANFINISFSKQQHEKMKQRSNYHSKHPDKAFAEERNMVLKPFLQKASDLYQQTEQQRLSLLHAKTVIDNN